MLHKALLAINTIFQGLFEAVRSSMHDHGFVRLPVHCMSVWDFRSSCLLRRVTANMDQRFPDATPEDLERSDNICIICREEMTDASRNKKLACNHVFHLHCLRYGQQTFATSNNILTLLWMHLLIDAQDLHD